MCGKRILILANNDIGLYKFRKELIARLLAEGDSVHISLPDGEYVRPLVDLGCTFIDTPIERRGTNVLSDIRLLLRYCGMLKKLKPDYVITYTIKPNIYGGMACAHRKVPFIANITGVGSAIKNNGFLSRLVLRMYRMSLCRAKTVFFQNSENLCFFQAQKIAIEKAKLLPGSGVNLEYFTMLEYPTDRVLRFALISRIMKEKGIEEFYEAARKIKLAYPNTEFHVCGFCEEEYEDALAEMEREGILIYNGMVADIRTVLKEICCVVHPSYHEGMANVLLEAAAAGRPAIASNIPGCREIISDGQTGFLTDVKSVSDLTEKLEHFIQLPLERKREMGILARRRVERLFDREIIINAYIDELHERDEVYDKLQ